MKLNLLLGLAFSMFLFSCGGDEEVVVADVSGSLLGNWDVISLVENGTEQMDLTLESAYMNFTEDAQSAVTWMDMVYVDMPSGDSNVLQLEYTVEDQMVTFEAASSLWGDQFEVSAISETDATLKGAYDGKEFQFELKKR